MDLLVLILYISAAINIILAIFSGRQARSTGSVELMLILICFSLYSFGYALELQSDNLSDIIMWVKIQYLGISFLPTLLLYFGLRYTGKGHLLKPWIEIVTLILSFVTLIIHFTNYNNLFYTNYDFVIKGDYILGNFGKGPWYWVLQAYFNVVLVSTGLMYLSMAIKNTGISKSRAIIMLIAIMVSWSAYIIYLTGLSPDHIDLSPVALSVTGIILAVGIFWFRLTDVVPLALEQVFNEIAAGIVILDDNKCLLSYNTIAVNAIPSLQGMKGRKILPVLRDYPVLAEMAAKGRYSDTSIEINVENNSRHYHVTFEAIRDVAKKPLGYTLMLYEITGMKKQELDLREQNEIKTKFLALIAHDLRNPFHVMMNISEMLHRDAEAGNYKSISKMAGILHNTSSTTYYLLKNLLEWAILHSRGMQPAKRALNVKNTVEDSLKEIEILYNQKAITFHCDINDSLTVDADEQMLKTTLRNLLSNAVKFSFPDSRVDVHAFKKDNEIVFEITDYGTGMSKKEQDLLFLNDGNFTRKGTNAEAGTGLGLILSREFIELHGGEIHVKSAPRKGSMFSFTLPDTTILKDINKSKDVI